MNKQLKKLLCVTMLFSSILSISSSVQIKAYSATTPRNQWKHIVYFAPYCGRNISAWNYYGSDGKAKEGWFEVKGKWYYGDQEHEDDFYGIFINQWAPSYYRQYLDSNRFLHVDAGNYDYYCGSDGALKTGWFQAHPRLNGDRRALSWFYAGKDGKILRNARTPDGRWANSEGICR